jgi:hypothetical protein
VCNHVAAILFKLEYVTRLEMSDPACTSAICQWDEPSKSNSIPVSVRLQDMKFTKPSFKKGKGKLFLWCN